MDTLANNIIRTLGPIHNSKAMTALRQGLLYALPAIILGEIALLLFQLPFAPLAKIVMDIGAVPILAQVYTSCFSISSLLVAAGIAHSWAKQSSHELMPAAVIAICCLLILIPSSIPYVDTTGSQIDVAGIDRTWLSAQSLWVAIACGLTTGALYSALLGAFKAGRKNALVLPHNSTAGLYQDVLYSLAPGTIMVVGCATLFGFSSLAPGSPSPAELATSWLQAPFEGLGDDLLGIIVFSISVPALWFFGIHGNMVAGKGLSMIAASNSASNAQLFANGTPLTVGNGARIVSEQFMHDISITGIGISFGLALCLVIFARSRRMRTIGIAGLLLSLFNMNEVLLYGTIVLSPLLIIPFVLMSLLSALVNYASIAIGLVGIAVAEVPWTMPPVMSGFFTGGIGLAIVQLLLLILSLLIYVPFVYAADKQAYLDEHGSLLEYASPLQRLFAGKTSATQGTNFGTPAPTPVPAPSPASASAPAPGYGYDQYGRPAQQPPQPAQIAQQVPPIQPGQTARVDQAQPTSYGSGNTSGPSQQGQRGGWPRQ